jgi:hypothetical protein
MDVNGQLHAPAALPPGEAPGAHWIGGWVGPKAVLNGVVQTYLNVILQFFDRFSH